MSPDDRDETHEDGRDAPAEASGNRARSIHDAIRPGTGRRAFLGALVAAGFGAGLARWRSVGDVQPADGSEVPIVYGFARTDPEDPDSVEPLKKTVSADWFEELSRVLAVHRELPVAELSGFVGSFVVPGNASDPAASISIQTTAGRLQDEVAELSLDVEFDVDVYDDLPDPTGDTRPLHPQVTGDLDARSVPGGVFCGNDEVRGSLAPALYELSSSRRYFATSNHLYGGSDADHRGDPLYLYTDDERTKIGRVRRGFPGDDLVLVDPVGGRVPASEIGDARPGQVGGQFTRIGLADLQARGEPMEMTGAISGHTSGRIEGVDGITFYTGEGLRTGQLIWGDEETFTDGDSGSVNYHVDPEDDDRLLIGGLNSARTWWPGADFTWGTAAYAIRERHGLTF